MIFLKKIKWWIYNWIGFVLVLCITSVAYWAYVSITNVNPGETLSASLFNEVLENQRVLKASVVPAWFVWTFNLSSCPTWWLPANGTNGTPDLRWEFVRWLDSWRWVDTGRVLASSQQATDILSNWSTAGGYGSFSTSSHNADSSYTTDIQVWAVTISSWPIATITYNLVRPRNVALLYCVKQ